MADEAGDGVERGRAGADPGAFWVRDGDGRGGGGEAAEAAGALELAVVERGLLRAGGREHDRVPGRHARRVPRREAQPAPRLPQSRRRLLRRVRPPPAPAPLAQRRRRVHGRRVAPRIGRGRWLVSPLGHRCAEMSLADTHTDRHSRCLAPGRRRHVLRLRITLAKFSSWISQAPVMFSSVIGIDQIA